MTDNENERLVQEERNKILLLKSRRVLYIAVGVIAIFLTMGYSFTVGTSSLSAVDAYKILINQIFPGMFGDFPDNYVFIVTELRAPRVLVGALIGAILAIGGCLMQSIMKNPLATPYTLGVSSGASLGATMFFIFGISLIPGQSGLLVNTFLFALLPILVMMFALTSRHISGTVLILTGVAFSYIFSSANSIMQYFGDDSAVANVVYWTMGDLTRSDMYMVPLLAVCLAGYLIYCTYVGKDLDIMRMGDDTASSLGVNVRAVRGSALIVSCLMTAVTVAFAGPIGFVCLIVPHICCRLVGNEIRWLVPMSACMGAMLLLIADMIAKTIASPMMLPVGAVTALIGAPMMIYILFRKKGAKA